MGPRRLTVRLLQAGQEPDWGSLADGDWARRFLSPLLQHGVSSSLANVRTQLRLVIAEDRVLPLTINDRRAPNAWVVSPYNAYVEYAAEETRELDHAGVRLGVRTALAGLGAVLRAGQIDRVVHVDNWCLSTNLHPPLHAQTLRELQRMLRETWPSHAHAWRSVHAWRDEPLPRELSTLGYLAIPARSCFIWDPHEPHHRGSRDLAHDARLLRNRGFEVIGPESLSAADVPRLRALYDALYLDKYSRHNPMFTDRFVQTAIDGGLTARALGRDGQLYGVIGYVARAGFMTTPLFGYDTDLPTRDGLYRMCSRILVDQAIEHGLVLHQSAGAASFKKNRRAEPILESTFVDVGHLPATRRAAWQVLQGAMDKVAVPLVRRAGL